MKLWFENGRNAFTCSCSFTHIYSSSVDKVKGQSIQGDRETLRQTFVNFQPPFLTCYANSAWFQPACQAAEQSQKKVNKTLSQGITITLYGKWVRNRLWVKFTCQPATKQESSATLASEIAAAIWVNNALEWTWIEIEIMLSMVVTDCRSVNLVDLLLDIAVGLISCAVRGAFV